MVAHRCKMPPFMVADSWQINGVLGAFGHDCHFPDSSNIVARELAPFDLHEHIQGLALTAYTHSNIVLWNVKTLSKLIVASHIIQLIRIFVAKNKNAPLIYWSVLIKFNGKYSPRWPTWQLNWAAIAIKKTFKSVFIMNALEVNGS